MIKGQSEKATYGIGENIFNPISDERSTSRIYEDLLQLKTGQKT